MSKTYDFCQATRYKESDAKARMGKRKVFKSAYNNLSTLRVEGLQGDKMGKSLSFNTA